MNRSIDQLNFHISWWSLDKKCSKCLVHIMVLKVWFYLFYFIFYCYLSCVLESFVFCIFLRNKCDYKRAQGYLGATSFHSHIQGIQRGRSVATLAYLCTFLCTVPVRSLDTPTHSYVRLYFDYFLYCRAILKTSKL